VKTIGLIGGMSWTSSLEYYRLLNEGVQERLGGLHSARCILYSVNFEDVQRLEHAGERERLARLLIDAARTLQDAGADCVLICANTQHRVADELEAAIDIPLIHIADATAEEARRRELSTVGLLGTRYTMEEGFYKTRLREKHGIETAIPGEEDRATVHEIIYDELCRDVITEESAEAVRAIIDRLVGMGAEGVVLGCTELPLLVKQETTEVPLISTTAVHARAAVDFALAPG
jgi:aspartate racemase